MPQYQEQTANGLQYVTEVSALYDLDTNEYSPVRITEAPFCAGHIYGPTVSIRGFTLRQYQHQLYTSVLMRDRMFSSLLRRELTGKTVPA